MFSGLDYMSYHIDTVQLTSDYASSYDTVALTYSRSDIAEAVDAIRKGRLDVKWILLSEELSDEYEQHIAKFWDELRISALKFAGSVLANKGDGILLNGAKVFSLGPGVNFSKDGFHKLDSFSAWCRQTPVKFNCGRIGIYTTARLKWGFLFK
jgi:hypothetical protein